ncbi:MAG: hypothetical protein ACFFEY_15835 [Candidatus Thorarchaeota archaeon]
MEIEKTRETSWKIQLKNKNENIEITSVEISGNVQKIKLAILNNENTVRVEMNKEEFFNFLSLISAFKDVVIGEQSLTIEEDFVTEDHNQNSLQEEFPILDNNLYQMNEDSKDNDFKNNDDELNPEEWDPW